MRIIRACLNFGRYVEKYQFFDKSRRKNRVIAALSSPVFQRRVIKKVSFADQLLNFKHALNVLFLIVIFPLFLQGQTFTYYFDGNPTDAEVQAQGGICLMGGATENDNAMRWFLERANGGDVLILRTSGSNGYNSYFFSDLGVSLNSVQTIVCHTADASTDDYVLNAIEKAEAIWFAGGDQWDYVSFWRDSPVQTAINNAIQNRNIVIGGTSAGMAIQGEYYFSAQNGTVTSGQALANPYHPNVTVDNTPFLANDILANTITDTHYDNPDRRGRHMTFLARMIKEYTMEPKGIACEEYTAVCIDTEGQARVFGDYPEYDDFALFLRRNCDLWEEEPDECEPGEALQWDYFLGGVKTYKVPGTPNGDYSFNLNDWINGTGGEWEHWNVADGVLSVESSYEPECIIIDNVDDPFSENEIRVSPNPTHGMVFVESDAPLASYRIIDALGREVKTGEPQNPFQFNLEMNELPNGHYFLALEGEEGKTLFRKIIKHH